MVLSGVGIGLRQEHWSVLPTVERQLDWLELVPENFVACGGKARRVLGACHERWPLGVHGVGLSPGGPDPLDSELLSGLGRLCDQLGVDTMTEHASWSRAHGRHFHDLLPLPLTEPAALHLAGRARAIRQALGRPLLLENITWYAAMPTGGEPVMTEGDWLTLVLSEADAGLLLDVNNVYVNALNHGLCPEAVLASLPLERTGRIHLAGHVERDGMLVDNHGAPVIEPVWKLFQSALRRTGPVPVLVEWDLEIPALDRVLDEADQARAILLDVANERARAASPKVS